MQLGQGVAGACDATHRSLGDINSLFEQACRGLGLGQLGFAVLICTLDAAARLAHEFAGFGLQLLGHRAHLRVEASDRAGLAGVLGARLL